MPEVSDLFERSEEGWSLRQEPPTWVTRNVRAEAKEKKRVELA
jgi:hypothetical protein